MPDFRPRSRGPLLFAGGGGLVVGALVTAAVMTATRPAPRRVAPAPSASASAGPGASASVAPPASGAPTAPAPESLAARAANGAPDAIQTLEGRARGERTAEEVVALARASAVGERRAIAELLRKIELVPKLAREPDTMKQLRGWADDGELTADLALGLAALPGSLGPDLLWELGPGYFRKSKLRELAEEVLYSKDVRAKASPALGVLLELRAATECEAVARTLERAKTEADRRAVAQIVKYENKFGCGPKKNEDCWACLRKTTLVKDTLKEAARRRGP
ncbi:MAG: hypothetical protein OZ928_19415 [Polyangiaceae bacterium]|nr:hypothetical protein [Polyangiaceae bacterium]